METVLLVPRRRRPESGGGASGAAFGERPIPPLVGLSPTEHASLGWTH